MGCSVIRCMVGCCQTEPRGAHRSHGPPGHQNATGVCARRETVIGRRFGELKLLKQTPPAPPRARRPCIRPQPTRPSRARGRPPTRPSSRGPAGRAAENRGPGGARRTAPSARGRREAGPGRGGHLDGHLRGGGVAGGSGPRARGPALMPPPKEGPGPSPAGSEARRGLPGPVPAPAEFCGRLDDPAESLVSCILKHPRTMPAESPAGATGLLAHPAESLASPGLRGVSRGPACLCACGFVCV